MKLKLIHISLIILIIIFFTNYKIVVLSTIEAFNIWLYKVFPFLFIMFVINDLLITLNFNSFFKNNILFVIIMALLSGSPSSAFIISSMYQAKKINYKTANFCLLFTHFINPLFLFSIFNYLFTKKIAIKLILIHYLSNFIIFIFYHKSITFNKDTLTNTIRINLGNSIKKAMNNLFMILGTIVFFTVITNIIDSTLNLNNINTLFIKGFLEITQGLNYLKNINSSLFLKELIAIIFISFGGISIHSQIKTILDEYHLEYNYYLKGRLLQLIISIILTIITKTH